MKERSTSSISNQVDAVEEAQESEKNTQRFMEFLERDTIEEDDELLNLPMRSSPEATMKISLVKQESPSIEEERDFTPHEE